MSGAVDVNKLKGLMKTMAQKVGLENINGLDNIAAEKPYDPLRC